MRAGCYPNGSPVARVRKKAARIGTWYSPDGPVTITPERCRHWAETHKRLRSAGNNFPVTWGHHLLGLPGNPEDPADADIVAFHRSRYNAGYIESLELDNNGDDGLTAVIDVPGLEERDGSLVGVAPLDDGAKVVTAIKDTSPGVGDWMDGKEQLHKDVFAHLALVTLPVQPGISGFQGLSTSRGRLTCFATNLPAEPKKKKPADADEVADLSEELTVPPDEELPGEGDDTGEARDPMADKVSRLKANLAKLGVTLPDTSGESDPMELIDHLDVAITALAGKRDADQAAEADRQMKERANPKPPVRAEEGPGSGMAMLATLQTTNPVAFGIVTDHAEKRRAAYAKKLDGFIGRGVPKGECDKLRAKLTGQQLSLDATGHPTLGEIARTITLLDRLLPQPGDPRALVGTERGQRLATALPSPANPDEDKPKVFHKPSGMEMTQEQHDRITADARR